MDKDARWQVLHGNCLEVLKTLPDNSIDAVVTDPPYGLSEHSDIQTMVRYWFVGKEFVNKSAGFMGKDWDSFVPGPEIWREVKRVLKPGGHLLAFSGSRTMDLMGISIRFAGFEMRDAVMAWLYGSGFPKSLNVSKAVQSNREADERAGLLPDEAAFCRWIREESKLSREQVQLLFGSDRFYTGKVEVTNTATTENPRYARRAMVPTAAAWAKFKEVARVESPEWVEALVKDPPKPSIEHPGEWKQGKGEGTMGSNEWAGWGTALKPAFEPVLVAQKPIERTVAESVQTYGTGALNIDGCRVGFRSDEDKAAAKPQGRATSKDKHIGAEPDAGNNESRTEFEVNQNAAGRWPPNVLLVHHPECVEEGDCHPECGVKLLDEQSGTKEGKGVKTIGGPPRSKSAHIQQMSEQSCTDAVMDYGDSGGASRFFPNFRYHAKVSRSERNAGLDDFPEDMPRAPNGAVNAISEGRGSLSKPGANVHPTVKPSGVMRWLIRLVTPQGGVVLDPFNGSGSTGIAAMKEGMRYVGIEREAEYVEIAKARIAHAAAETEAKPFPKLKEPEPPKPAEPLPTPEGQERSTRSLDPDYFKKLVAKSMKKGRK